MKQLWFPFIDPWEQSEIRSAVEKSAHEKKISECIGENQVILWALRISNKKLAEVLNHPSRHWKKIRKQKGKKIRICYSPSKELRKLQHRAAIHLINRLRYIEGFSCSTAFMRGCSVVRNAYRHFGNQSSLVLDLKNAFESITARHIFHCLCRYLPESLAWLFSRLFTYKGKLRQGPPVSPWIYNLLMNKFDVELAKAIGAYPYRPQDMSVVYTRYGDDLCFSSPDPVFPKSVEEKIRQVVRSFGLRLNNKRTTGKDGNLVFPGVRILKARVTPSLSTIRRYAELQKQGGSPEALKSYRAFFNQFPKSGLELAERFVQKMLQSTP